MRINSTRLLILLTILVSSFVSCSEKKEDWVAAEPITDYLPLTEGKYITYRVDSLVPNPSFNTTMEIHSYQVKHVVDVKFTDNLGRPSYRIFRYINNANATGNWQASGSYFITPLTNSIESVEQNLRFIKLVNPMREGFEWKANAYLPNNPFQSMGYSISIDDAMGAWESTYDLFESSTQINGQTYNDVWTVEQVDQSEGDPVQYPSSYANRARFVEKYSKNIGLVYRQMLLWEYEVNGSKPAYSGFGITMWMIDHN
jgi:hypothetical protein